MNKSAKGSRMEKLCMEEFQQYIGANGYRVLKSWKTVRSRAGGNDFFDAWDLALLVNNKDKDERERRMLFLVQVKSVFKSKEIRRLAASAIGTYCYLAVYRREPRLFRVKLPHFWLVWV